MVSQASGVASDRNDDSNTKPEPLHRITPCRVHELEFFATKIPDDPWRELRLDVQFIDPTGAAHLVPAFWAGGRSWRARYSSRVAGVHKFRTIAGGVGDPGLEGHAGSITIGSYSGANELLLRGAPTVGPDGKHLMYEDGTPFFWLGDTWWSGLTARFRWPDTFQALTADRVAKGFTVVQVVAGLVPEFGLFSPMMASEGGQPWQDCGRGPINPAFYDVPDLKIEHLVAHGVVPCIVGGWGSWLQVLGQDKIIEHWRYLVARYAAYPVVWCVAGEVEWPTPFAPMDGEPAGPTATQASEDLQELSREQAAGWEEASQLVAEIDPAGHLRTVHPCPLGEWSSSRVFQSRDSFEIDMLQTGHGGFAGFKDTMDHLMESLVHGDKPVINGEPTYEGFAGSWWSDIQRLLFWSHMLSGTAGHTYGTMPISTFSARDDHYIAPSQGSSADWEDAIEWDGSTHVGIGRRILQRFRWWELAPAPDAVEPHAGPDDWFAPYAAKTDDGTMIIYLPGLGQSLTLQLTTQGRVLAGRALTGLAPGGAYRASYVNPRSGIVEVTIWFTAEGARLALEDLRRASDPTTSGSAPTSEDWVLVVQPMTTLKSVSAAPW